MSHSRTIERGIKPAKPSSLIALLLALVSLFAVGCGDSGEDFVRTGNDFAQPPSQTGTVTFQFARAQQVANVPAGTTKLHFDFFNADGAEVFQADRDFDTTVTIEGVPPSTTRAVVTALDANNVPLATLLYNLQVVAGGTSTATLLGPDDLIQFTTLTATPDPINMVANTTQQLTVSARFSDGSSLPVDAALGVRFSSRNSAIANVTANGLVAGVAAGNTTVDVSLVLNGVSRTDTVTVNVTAAGGGGGGGGGGGTPGAARLDLAPTTVTLTNTSTSATIVATFFPANSTNGQIVTAQTTSTPPTGLTYTPATGTITSTTGGQANSTVNLVVRFTSGTTTVNNTVTVNINRGPATGGVTPPPGTPARLDVTPDTLTLAANTANASGRLQARFFAANSTTGVLLAPDAVTVTFSNANPPGTENRYSYNPTGVNAGQINTSANGGAADGNTVTATFFRIQGGVTLTDTVPITVNTANANLVQSARVASLVGTSLRLPQGSTYPVVIEETLQSGAKVTVPPANIVTAGSLPGQYTLTSSSASATYTTGTAILTLGAIGTSNIAISRNNGAPAGGSAVTLTFSTDTVNSTDLVDPPAKRIALVATPTTASVGTGVPYRVELRYKTGLPQDITPVVGMTTTANLTQEQIAGGPAAGVNVGIVVINAVGGGSLAITNAVVLTNGASFPGVNLAADTDFAAVAITGN